MFENLMDVGFVFISLAFIGFLLKDAYNTGLFFEFPFLKRSSLEVIFHYCSISVFALSFVFLIFYGTIRNSSIVQSDPNLQMYFSLLYGLSIFYLVAWIVATVIGLYMRYFSLKCVNATFFEDGVKKTEEFPTVMLIDEDYVYFEKFERNCWKCIPKKDVFVIESKINSQTRFRIILTKKWPWVKKYKIYIIFLLVSVIIFEYVFLTLQNWILSGICAVIGVFSAFLISE